MAKASAHCSAVPPFKSTRAAAAMALAGIVGHIPADEVIDAMAEVGNAMSKDLRETGIGGLAGTPTGRKIAEIVTMSADTEEED